MWVAVPMAAAASKHQNGSGQEDLNSSCIFIGVKESKSD